MRDDSTRASGEGRSRRRNLPGIAVALAFLVTGVATLGDRGLTWDEPETLRAGAANLEIVRSAFTGDGAVEWPWHELRGYQFVFDTTRVAFARAAEPLVGGPERAGTPIRGLHLAHLLLASAVLFLVFRIALEVSGSVRVATLSTLVLATSPKLVAHSQNNPKDLVAVFVYTLFLWALERALAASCRLGRWCPGAFAAAGIALGLAFASHVLSALLVPMAAAWVVVRLPVRPGRAWRDRVASLAVLGASAAAVAFALWPWLWADPIIRTARVLRRVALFPVGMDVLYLGRIYPEADPPYHYFVVSLLVATPVVFTLAATAGALMGLRPSTDPPGRRLALLALLWAGVPMLVEAFTSSRYDGVRHLLAVLPAVALLGGLGLDRLVAAAGLPGEAAGGGGRRRLAARGLLVVAAGAWLWAVVDLVRYHPYQDAYLNAPVRRVVAALDRRPEELFELEYWGSSYREGARWLNEHAPAGAVVHVPVAGWCAAPYLDPDLVLRGPAWLEEPPDDATLAAALRAGDGPRFLMLMTRTAFLPEPAAAVRRTREPVHTVERLGATLLEIYRLDRPDRQASELPVG